MTDRRSILQLAIGVTVLGSAVVLVLSAIVTSSARVKATTEGTTFFSAGVVELVQPGTAVELLFDSDGLYPGKELSGCVEVEYRGSIPASVRLHGALHGGSGLELFTNLTVSMAPVASCSSATPAMSQQAFDGLLGDFSAAHPDYATGLVLDPAMLAGDRLVLLASVSLVDDNRAQGLTTDFAFVIEARP